MAASLERRAIQLGLRGEILARYAREWIIEIEDISAFVAEQRTCTWRLYKSSSPAGASIPILRHKRDTQHSYFHISLEDWPLYYPSICSSFDLTPVVSVLQRILHHHSALSQVDLLLLPASSIQKR